MTIMSKNHSKTKQTHSQIDEERLNVLAELVSDRIEEFLLTLDVPYVYNGRYLKGACPVHGGDNPSGWAIYPWGDSVKCRWKCFTRGCHDRDKYGGSLFGFVRGLLSHQTGKQVTFHESVNYVCNFLGRNLNSIKVDYSEVNKSVFINQSRVLNKSRDQQETGVNRAKLRTLLDIPARYYVKRGYSPLILDRYDVGSLKISGHKLSNRVVIPVYDDNHKCIVGLTARSLLDECGKCGYHHLPGADCPTTDLERYHGSKWLHNGPTKTQAFDASHFFYNFWFAKESISTSQTIVITESPGNVWRLVQNGIPNVVGSFGTNITDDQSLILECSGAMNIVFVPDNDEAGQQGAIRNKENLKNLFNVSIAEIDFGKHGDVGEMPDEYVREKVIPKINRK